MNRPRRWSLRSRRGVSEIIAVILLIALTLVAGAILWSFRISPSPTAPSVNFVVHSGGSNPVWGDPTDCQPKGSWVYPLTGSTNINNWNNGFYNECAYPATSGNYSLLNTSELVVSAVSAPNILLTDINLTFICNGTVLIQGTLASMTWFPGSSFAPAPNAPYLGYCGTFNAGGYGGGAFGTLYNRLGIFVPITNNSTTLESGDTFILYIHNGGYPQDYACTTNWIAYYYGLCQYGVTGGPIFDFDDYHGAPPWCFTSPHPCTFDLSYTGTPGSLLASIPVSDLAPPPT